MYRVVNLSGKYYAKKLKQNYFEDIDKEEQENIQSFLDSGDGVLFINDLQDLDNFDIDSDDVEIVK